MANLYTPQVRQVMRNFPRPKECGRLVVDVVEYPRWLALRLYADNLESLSEPHKLAAAEYVIQLCELIRNIGVPCYVEKVDDDPR